MRITVPAVVGFRPRSDARMDFSIGCTMFFSHGVIVIDRASATATLATCVIGTSEP